MICFIHDDGSNDNTLKIVSKYMVIYQDKFVVLTYEKAGGAKKIFFL